jgi:hypothetical protein
MGCDIHAKIEFQPPYSNHWSHFAEDLNLGRNYVLFAFLVDQHFRGTGANIKGEVPERGLPTDGDSYRTYTEEQLNEMWTKRKTENPDECIDEFRSGTWIGQHTFTWLTPEEFENALTRYDEWSKNSEYHKPEPEYWAVHAMMKSLKDSGINNRLIIGFDN